jgi:hypothetical protein
LAFWLVLAKEINPSFLIDRSMPTLDVAMPLALLIVVTAAVMLNKRVESRLMATVEQKQFKKRDIVFLVVFMAIVISAIAYITMVAPGATLQNILLIAFLSSYTMLLFTFSYVFSNVSPLRTQLLSVGFGVASVVAGLVALNSYLTDMYTIYRAIAFFTLAVFCFGVAVYELLRPTAKSRWYLAAQPPTLFLFLFVFFNFLHTTGTTQIWFPLLMDLFGFTFAILIILYLSSLFKWKTVGIFAVLLTIMDIILVIGTGTMVQAATQFTGLGLPVLVYLPNVPLIEAVPGNINFFGYAPRGLGLGDFFFAGVLAVQTFKKFGNKTGYATVVSMAIAFGIWEAFLGDILRWLGPIVGRDIGGFPGTLMIVCGWAPIVAIILLRQRTKPVQAPQLQAE